MPTSQTKYTILLSSPNDVSDERQLIETIVAELNKTWGIQNSATIEILSWENVPSGIGSEPQDVINKSLGTDWDIYLGIMHTRFGSPTKGFGSGTEEEFERAVEVHEKDKSHKSIMFYFKGGMVDVNAVDTEQLEKVRHFKKRLGDRGIFYHDFPETEQLGSLIRIHLPKVLEELRAAHSASKFLALSPAKMPQPELLASAESPGYLDLAEFFHSGSKALLEILTEMNANSTTLATEMTEATNEVSNANQAKDLVQLRKGITLASGAMRRSAGRYADQRRRYVAASTALFETISRMVASGSLQAHESQGFKTSIAALKSQISNTAEIINSLEKTLAGLPNFASDFNSARLLFKNELNSMKKEFRHSADLLDEI